MKNTYHALLACVAIFAAAALLCATTAGFGSAPAGVQCPTASVQQVKVAIRDCCDRVIGYETRAPKSGEKAFVQCHCAEKKEAAHQATLSGKIDLFLNSPDLEVSAVKPSLAFVRHLYARTITTTSNPPSPRPPSAA